MGEALRICVDLDLQNELKTKSKQNFNIDNFTRDKRRRIFWCCYSIDRQICFIWIDHLVSLMKVLIPIS